MNGTSTIRVQSICLTQLWLNDAGNQSDAAKTVSSALHLRKKRSPSSSKRSTEGKNPEKKSHSAITLDASAEILKSIQLNSL